MYTITIPHPIEGQKPIKFETEDRKLARMAVLVGKAIGVEAEAVVSVDPKKVKFKGIG